MAGFFRRLFCRHPSTAGSGAHINVPVIPDDDDYFYQDGGLPYPRWKKIGDWVAEHVDAESFDEAYTQAVRLWLARLAVAVGGGLTSVESPNFVLFSPLEKTGRQWVLKTLEGARRSIFEALGTLAWAQRWGKHVVLVLPRRLYVRYIAHYYPGDYMGRSAGVMIPGGYAHIAANLARDALGDNQLQQTLAHELTHSALCQLNLPRWLDEALAMSFEDQLGGGETSIADRLGSSFEAVGTQALLREFAEWWSPERMQSFWSGELWNSPDDEQAHCYEMARIVFRKIRQLADGARERFRGFIGDATQDDSGEAAAQKYFGLSLGDVAADFLGEGDWEPQPVGW